MILPGSKIGIIGGNHISKMLVMSAKKMGMKVGILDPSETSPAGEVADWQMIASYNDESALINFSNQCDLLIYGTKNIDVRAIDYLIKDYQIPQGVLGLTVTQDRLIEREFLDNHSINIVPFETAVLISDIKIAAQTVGYPCVVKSTSRYDGENEVVIISSEKEVDLAVPLIQQGACLVESYVSIEKELFLSIGVNESGEFSLFPLVEKIRNENGELSYIKAPNQLVDLDESTVNQIELIAQVVASELGVCGIVGIEFFLTETGNLVVNEVTSLPSDYAKYSLDACDFSEYDIQIRSSCNWPLPKIHQLLPGVTMDINNENYEDVLSLMENKRQWLYHFYGETVTKKGHITVLSTNLEEAIQEIRYAGLLD